MIKFITLLLFLLCIVVFIMYNNVYPPIKFRKKTKKYNFVYGDKLSDEKLNKVIKQIKLRTGYKPQTTLIYYHNIIDVIPVDKSREDIQILFDDEYSKGHWICIRYINGKIYIYDSLYSKKISSNQLKVLEKLYPFFNGISNIKDNLIYVEPIVKQSDNWSCGYFAATYLILLAEKISFELFFNNNGSYKNTIDKMFYLLENYLTE